MQVVGMDSVVVSSHELDRVRTQLGRADPFTQRQQQKREDRKMRSTTRTKNWSNSVQAQGAVRMKKQQARAKKEEGELRRLDAEEKAILKAKRTTAIKRAQNLMHQEKQKVKELNSKLFLADVMVEREAQIELKRRRQKMLQKRDTYYIKIQKEKSALAEEAERVAAEERHVRNLEQAEAQQQQLKHFREKLQRQQFLEMREGDRLKRQASKMVQEEKQRLKAKVQQQKEDNMRFKQENERLETLRFEARRRELAEEAKIKEYADNKERTERRRNEVEAQRFAEKQRIRQRLIDQQTAYLQKLRDDEDERVSAQVEASNQAFAARVERDTRNRHRRIEEDKSSRQLQIEKKREAALRTKRADAERVASLLAELEEQNLAEKQLEQQRRINRVQNNQFLFEQMAVKKSRERAERQAELDYTRKLAEDDAREDQELQTYVDQHLDKYRKQGRNVSNIERLIARPKRLGEI